MARDPNDTRQPRDIDLTRRQLLGVAAGAAAVAPLLNPSALAAAATATTKFLTPAELALLDELTEMIIPTDDHSPGARAAKVAPYIDARLAEAFEPEIRTRWRDGLKGIDTLAASMHDGKAFMSCTPDQRLATLTRFAEHEKKPESADDKFFVELKGWTVNVYYTSDIGMHQEMDYKGNTLQQEYSGIDVSQK
jgi:hypothetical protein